MCFVGKQAIYNLQLTIVFSLNVLFAYRVAMPVKKIVIINRQASDAQTVLRYFCYLSRSLIQLEKKLNCADIAPLTEEKQYRMANKCKEHNK